MSNIRRLFGVLLYVLAFAAGPASAQTADSFFTFRNQNSTAVVGPAVQYFIDSSNRLSEDAVVRQPFRNADGKILNFGVSNAALWTRFKVKNETNIYNVYLEVANPLLGDVLLYEAVDGSLRRLDAVSNRRPFYERSIPNQNATFRVRVSPGQTAQLYLRLTTNAQMLVPMQLHSAQYYQAEGLNKDLLSAFYFGIMLSMLLYNLFIYVTVREKIYLYYVLYILSVTLVQLDIKGLGFKFIYPDAVWLQSHATVLYSSFTAFASIAFMRSFVRVRLYTPKLNKGLTVFVAAYALALLLSFVGYEAVAYNMLNLNGLLLALYMMSIAAIVLVKYRFRPAGYFLVAWTLFLVGIIVFVLKDVGVLPYNTFTTSILQLGSAVETVLLSIALADRINTLKKEKELSQAQALASAQENERLVRERNVDLERKVAERTRELKATNQQLETTLTDLKDTQTQMVEQEKMASLGQLTAGIAHEINNPINFVTSNIKPLSRDFDDVIRLYDQVEAIALDEQPVDAKKKAIQKARADVDFDYLKEEVAILMKGIHEGATRTAEIVKGLRIFSRLDEADLKRASVQEGLDSTCLIVNNLLNNRIEIVKDYEELPLIECYAGKLNQVFLNLMTNAIHAIKARWGDQQGGQLTVRTRNTARQSIVIEIDDNGTGMEDAVKQRIFEPFFTTKDVGEGTGLGLSITWKTIQKHNGTVNATSEMGRGTTFTIELPIAQPSGAENAISSMELATAS